MLSPTKEVLGGEELSCLLTSSLVVLRILLLTTKYFSTSDPAPLDVMSCDFPIEETLDMSVLAKKKSFRS